MAIRTSARPETHSIVLERDQQIDVQKTPMQLIRASCLRYNATYEGRKRAMTSQHGYKRKVPIPINPQQGTFAFPTHATKDFRCQWIFFEHILRITPYPANDRTAAESIITFKNGKRMKIAVSYFVLKKQMQRTLACVVRAHESDNGSLWFM